MPTSKKLQIFYHKKKIIKSNFSKIKKYKQYLTKKLLKESLKEDKKLIQIFKYLKKKNYKIGIATNAIKSTLNICLSKLKISKFIDIKFSNEDVKNSKPNPEIYLKMFIHFGLYPSEVLIFEDSHYGREAAITSGAKLYPVKNIDDIELKKIKMFLNKKKNKAKKKLSWEDNKMNV